MRATATMTFPAASAGPKIILAIPNRVSQLVTQTVAAAVPAAHRRETHSHPETPVIDTVETWENASCAPW
jgi:hypothetical protein